MKYSEKQIGISYGNLHKLHLLSNSSPPKTWLSTRSRIFSSTSMVQVLPNRKSLDFDYLKSRQMRCFIYIQNSQMNLAFAAGNPGWSRTWPKLVVTQQKGTNVIYINTRKSCCIDRKCWKSFRRPTADCSCCFQFQFTPLHKAERRNHHSIVKLLLDHKARPTLQQPVRNIPMNIYILSCCVFVCLFRFLKLFCVLCFKKYYMASARNSLVFTASVVRSAYRWLWPNARHAMG